jgi:hypothetical protein
LLKTRGALPATPSPTALQVEVLESVSLIPQRLTFHLGSDAPPQPQRVQIVRRLPQADIALREYDRNLLSVTPIQHEGRVTGFEFMPRNTSKPAESEVVFRTSHDQVRKAIVRFVINDAM